MNRAITKARRQVKNAAVGSWKTTISGVITFVVAAGPQIQHALDSDPETVPNWNTVIIAAGVLVGLLFSRDNNVTSEAVGAE